MITDWLAMGSSAFNAGYFLLYRSPLRRRWLGAKVLAIVNLGILGEGVRGAMSGEGMAPGRALLALGALLITLFILHQLLLGRGR